MRIVILAVDGVADSGLGLVQDVLAAANLLRERVDPHIAPFETSVCATQPQVRTYYGLTVAAQPLADALHDAPAHLVVPGLGLLTEEAVVEAVTGLDAVPVVRELHAQGLPVSAACSGTFVLAEAGVLDGRTATTSWWLGPAFRRRYPAVALQESEALVVADGVTTAGAALAHLDLALTLVRRVSPALAEAVSDYLAVGDRPRQGEFVRPGLLAPGDSVLAAFDRAVRDRIGEPLDLAEVASGLGISMRTLQRLTAASLGTTPIGYVQHLRLERAVDLLRTTDQSVASIARAVGYQDATTLATLIRRRRGATPEEVRSRRVTTTSSWGE